MEDEYENQDSLNTDGTDTDLDTDGANDDFSYEEPVVTDEDPEKVKLAEQNRRLYARIKKLEARKEQPKAEPAKPEPKEEPKASVIDPEAIKSSLRDELRLEAQGFNEEEQAVIKRAATALGISLLDAAKDDIVKGKIEAMREEQKVQNAIPSPSGKAGTTDTNSVEYYLRTGEIPEDDDLADKVDQERIRRAKEQI